jgi:excisionase family DNA binding protein
MWAHSDEAQCENKRWDDVPEILTPSDLMRLLPIGRNAVYSALKQQVIRNVRLGQKFLITKQAVREFLEGRSNVSAVGTPTEENTVWGT